MENMGQIKKIVLIKNAVETLGYFSVQLAQELEVIGFDTYFVDYDNLYASIEGLSRFVVKGETALLTFNCIGLSGEEVFLDEKGRCIWDVYEMGQLNILVDHPMYYHARLVKASPLTRVYCIDREHVRYVKRFYPEVVVSFLPIAGNQLLDACAWNGKEIDFISYQKRPYDVVFTANYVSFDELYSRIKQLDEEYFTFYRGILDDLLSYPLQSVDVVMERHIRAELGEVTDKELAMAMAGMPIIDLCARTYLRGEIIKELAAQDVKVHVFGADWDRLSCVKKENIISNGRQIHSAECVESVRNAKIALNVMPWFKDGAHDRIFTAMLQQTVALTDDSCFLRQHFTDGENIAFFSLEEIGEIPCKVKQLLGDEEWAMRIAQNGYIKTQKEHTWQARALALAAQLT